MNKNHPKQKLRITMRGIVFLCLFISFTANSQAWLKVPNSSDFYPFGGGTNDYLFIKGEAYMMSESPLAIFKGYELIYATTDEIKYTISYDIPISQDKDYTIYWAVGLDSILYLCDVDIWDEEDFNQKVWMNYHKYYDYDVLNMQDPQFLKYSQFYMNPSKYMRHIPLERLTGQKFKESVCFNKSITHLPPINEKGVISAVWYSDTLYVKQRRDAIKEPYSPYYQLIIKNGKIIKSNKIIPIVPVMPKRRNMP